MVDTGPGGPDDAADPGGDLMGVGSALLPPLVHESSAALLVVDLAAGMVIYANELARQLAPGHRLPMPVAEWSDAAGLEDTAGIALAEGTVRGGASSLHRIAQGQPITGEAVTARRPTTATDARETLWVLALPLTGAPAPIDAYTLVTFLPARNAQLIAGAQEAAVSVRDRAVSATPVSFTITDPNEPDDPLVWVNPAFTATTGYAYEEAVGRNCRFLQGPDSDPMIVAEIAESLAAGRPLTTTLLNYRKDGSTFWNELSISPVRDQHGRITHFVGVQADVTARVQAQQSRDRALSQVAQAADRLALLADFTSRMALGQSPDQIVEMIGSVLVPRVGSLAAVVLFDDSGRTADPFVLHESAAPELDAGLARLRERFAGALDPGGPIRRVLNGETSGELITDLVARPDAEPAAELRAAFEDVLNVRSMIALPLLARRGILGAVVVLSATSRPPMDEADVALIRDLAVRAGLMLENTQLYAREQAVAATLQRSLLPTVAAIAGVEVSASYLPAADEAAVGGDWYDVFALRESGGVGVAVGDVMGHNVDSAARMGKLSTIVRAYGWPGSEPNTVLTAVDELLDGGTLDYLATCFYGTLRLHGNGATLTYSSAGHPPGIVRRPGGSAVVLDQGRGPMLGVAQLVEPRRNRPNDAALDLAPGSTLICFTDGLTDAVVSPADLDAGLARLIEVLEELPADADPDQVVAALQAVALRRDDDIAILAIRIS